MKRILILIALLLLSVWTASAQGDLQVGAVFDGKVVPATSMKETFIRSSRLETYHLEQYRSVSFTGDDQVLAEVSRRRGAGLRPGDPHEGRPPGLRHPHL